MTEVEKQKMVGVREYAEDMPVRLYMHKNGRWVIEALNEAGYNGTDVDLLDLLSWLRNNRPELLQPDHVIHWFRGNICRSGTRQQYLDDIEKNGPVVP